MSLSIINSTPLMAKENIMNIFSAIFWLTLNVYYEARSEPIHAQVAVANVTMNRAKLREQSIKEVVNAPFQFTWTMEGHKYPKDLKALSVAYKAVILAIEIGDVTGGADHYHRVDVYPEWRKDMQYLTTIGEHKFYKSYSEIPILAEVSKIKHN
jgi:N-acetylmuramoyl-L-alanine amidase